MTLPRFSLRQLDVFVAVAECRGFRAAAERASLTPSAVSQLVGELEATVGFKLFDRTTRKVALSAAGREFLGPARTALRYLKLAESAAGDLRLGSAGIVRIAAPQVLASGVLPAALKAYQREQPMVAVRIRDTTVDRLASAVVLGDVDMALGPDQDADGEVERHAVLKSPWMLWCVPEHPLAQRRTVAWSALRTHAVVAAGRDHERSVMQMRLDRPANERIVPIDIVDNITTALGMAAANLAVTFSPAYARVLAEPMGLVMRPLVAPTATRQIALIAPSARQLSPAAQGLLTFLLKRLRSESAASARGKNPEYDQEECLLTPSI